MTEGGRVMAIEHDGGGERIVVGRRCPSVAQVGPTVRRCIRVLGHEHACIFSPPPGSIARRILGGNDGQG
jgi:hypothetical protein